MKISEFLEQRKYPRALVDAQIKILTPPESKAAKGMICLFSTDISLGGIFIETPHPLAVGAKMRLEVKLPSLEEPMILEGKVVRNNMKDLRYHYGMGIEFENLGEENKKIINEYVQNELEQEKVIRRILKAEPVKEIMPSAQFQVLTNPNLDVVLKVQKSIPETLTLLDKWNIETMHLPQTTLEDWAKRVINAIPVADKVIRERLLKSKAIYFFKELKGVEYIEDDGEGNLTPMEKESVIIQKKADMVLYEALRKYYHEGNIDVVKFILNETIRQTHEEQWSYGAHDLNNSFMLNWGIDFVEEGLFSLRLFDVWELASDGVNLRKTLDVPREEVSKWIDTTWEYYDLNHPFSLINLMGKDVVDWFKQRVLEEYNVEKFDIYWESKLDK